MLPDQGSAFSLHFSAEAWSQIGSLGARDFELLHTTLEHFAVLSATRLRKGEPPTIDVCVPIAAGRVVAECSFDDHRRRITVQRIEAWRAAVVEVA